MAFVIYFYCWLDVYFIVLFKMASPFIDTDFEPAMCFLLDTLDNCIESKTYGWIHKKFGNFAVTFIFRGIKKSLANVKRKAVNDVCGPSKKVQKLNISLENLFLDDSQDETILDAISLECAIKKCQTRSSRAMKNQGKNDSDACSSDDLKVRENRKRSTSAVDIPLEISDQMQQKKVKKKE